MQEDAELTLIFSEIGILACEVIEEGIIVGLHNLLHLSPVATRVAILLQTLYHALKLVTHRATIHRIDDYLELVGELRDVVMLLVLLQLLQTDNLCLVAQLLLVLGLKQAVVLALQAVA